MAKKDYDKAIRDFDEAIRIYPDLASFYATRGDAYRMKGELDRAIADCNEAIRLDDPRHQFPVTLIRRPVLHPRIPYRRGRKGLHDGRSRPGK
jgi:tetratricopeptide (TPR) repeat protein